MNAEDIVEIKLEEVNLQTEKGIYLYKKDIDLILKSNEFYILRAPSGTGKTVLMNMIVYLKEPSVGSVWWAKNKIDSLEKAHKLRTKYISLIPSNFIFIENLTVKENLELVALANNIKDFEDRLKNIYEYLTFEGEEFGEISLDKLMNKKIRTLSNGQKEIVTIARALMLDSPFIFGDETFRSFPKEIDKGEKNIKGVRGKIIEKVVKYILDKRKSFFLITHDPDVEGAVRKSIKDYNKENQYIREIVSMHIEDKELKILDKKLFEEN